MHPKSVADRRTDGQTNGRMDGVDPLLDLRSCHSTLCGCQRAYFTYNSLVINNDLSHFGGYIYSIGLVKAVSESLQELVRASSSSMLVTLNNV